MPQRRVQEESHLTSISKWDQTTKKGLPSVLMAWRFDKVGYTGDVQTSVTGLISLIYEKYYKLMEVLYIFPMIFKVKPIFNPI